MKGTLTKADNGWQVSHATYDMVLKRWTAGKLPLHPDNVKEIEEDSKIFDNIEARIAAYPEVEFEIKYYWDETMEQPIDVAKLIKTEYPELEGTMNLGTDIIKKRTGKMTEEEWQEAERAQTSTKMPMYSIEWLMERYLSRDHSLTITDFHIAKEMHKQEIIDAWENAPTYLEDKKGEDYYQETFCQDVALQNNSESKAITELSDEEIEEEISKRYMHPTQDYAFRDACKWYREQLKLK